MFSISTRPRPQYLQALHTNTRMTQRTPYTRVLFVLCAGDLHVQYVPVGQFMPIPMSMSTSTSMSTSNSASVSMGVCGSWKISDIIEDHTNDDK